MRAEELPKELHRMYESGCGKRLAVGAGMAPTRAASLAGLIDSEE